MDIKNRLLSMQDNEYKTFHSKLMPTIDPNTIIGIRVPVLRSFAKQLYKENNINDFLNSLPHQFYEENNLHAFLIEQIKDFEICISEVDKFLPYINNWATCDSLRPNCFKKNKETLLLHIHKWMKSDYTYTKSFAIEILMPYFLDEDYKIE